MSEKLGSAVLVIPSFFGAIHVWVDQKVVGLDRLGQETDGAVTKIRIGEVHPHTAHKSQFVTSVSQSVKSYVAGDLAALDTVGVVQPGSEFRQKIWQTMRSIEHGTAISYAALAQRSDHPQAFRAAASACSQNAIPLLVPCHRVITSSGALGKYFYGQEMKIELLRHENYL